MRKGSVRKSIATAVFTGLIGLVGAVQAPLALAEAAPSADGKASPQEVRKNLDFLYAKVFDKVERFLTNTGTFYPFGAGMAADGRVNFVWAVSQDDKNVNPNLALSTVIQALQANAAANRMLGSAVAYWVTKKDEKTGKEYNQIHVELEYADGTSYIRAARFEVKDGKVAWGAAGEAPMPTRIFGAIAPPELLPEATSTAPKAQ